MLRVLVCLAALSGLFAFPALSQSCLPWSIVEQRLLQSLPTGVSAVRIEIPSADIAGVLARFNSEPPLTNYRAERIIVIQPDRQVPNVAVILADGQCYVTHVIVSREALARMLGVDS